MAAVSLDGPSEVEPLRRLYGHALDGWLVDHLAVTVGEIVLELASGLGAMCVRLAEVVGPGGRAICSDVRPERVEATRRSVPSAASVTVDARVLDMLGLELPDESVDGILCRWGFMYALPTELAFREARRVLRPGRALSLAVWAEPARNPWIASVDDALVASGHVPPSDRCAPGAMFSLADPERLHGSLEAVGFEEVVVDEVAIAWGYDDLDAYWAEEVLVAGPYEDYILALDPAGRTGLRERLRSTLEPYETADGYRIPGVTLVATARRPTGRT